MLLNDNEPLLSCVFKERYRDGGSGRDDVPDEPALSGFLGPLPHPNATVPIRALISTPSTVPDHVGTPFQARRT